MKVYQRFDVDEKTPAQFVAVHPLRWRPEWGEPSDMFRDVDLIDVPEVAALVEACKLAKQHLDALRLEAGVGNYLAAPQRETFRFVDETLTAALAPFQEADDGDTTE